VERCGRGHAIWCMCIACWITVATDTHPEYAVVFLFHSSSGYTSAPQYYIHVYLSFFATTNCCSYVFLDIFSFSVLVLLYPLPFFGVFLFCAFIQTSISTVLSALSFCPSLLLLPVSQFCRMLVIPL